MANRKEEYRLYDLKRSDKRKQEYIENREEKLRKQREDYHIKGKFNKRQYYLNNKIKINKRQQEYYKTYDKKYECHLKWSIKKFTEVGKKFKMTEHEYRLALLSWAYTIKKLDNHMCKLCSSKEELNAHHIMPKKDFHELSLDLDNGITLCKKCHYKTHWS